MRVLIAGAHGFIGSSLAAYLRARRCDVRRIVRSGSLEPGDVSARRVNEALAEGVDAVINLAGANIGAQRWTASFKRKLWQSRVDTTTALVRSFENAPPRVFISASAVGYYGDRGEQLLDESAAPGAGFLPELSLAWEAAAAQAAKWNVRVVFARFGIVLGAAGGALAKMRPLFKLGLGGMLGSGRQFMSWIALEDALRALEHCLNHDEIREAVNIAAPAPVRNAEFSQLLAASLSRPCLFRIPAPVLRLLVGEMANEALLASARVEPKKLRESAFQYRHPTLQSVLTVFTG